MLRDSYATWRCGSHEISLVRPRIMGILNVTPDSFFDGGAFVDEDGIVNHELAIRRALQMLDEGADIIDVGGESTRPGHEPTPWEVELDRVAPVVEALVERGAIVSVDTRHAEVARTCLELGAHIVNDVSGFSDPAMVEAVSESDCGLIVMHWNQKTGINSRKSVQLYANHPARRSLPSSRRFTLPDEAPVMREVMGFLGDQARTLMRAGIRHERIAVDPGAGFSKGTDEDVIIQRNTKLLVSMGYPVVCAVSRKRFVGAISSTREATDREAATLGVCLSAIADGARIVRVHDVKSAFEAISTWWATCRADSRQAFVAMGSNVKDPLGYLCRAARLMDRLPLTCVTAVSNAYETAPAYGLETPCVNAVAELHTELHPLVLLGLLLDIEDQLGRTREPGATRPGPRTIDLDLSWYEGEYHAGERLRLPHPGLGERDFVLVPLEDLMPDPVRFLTHAGVRVTDVADRVGQVLADLGPVSWETVS